MIATTHRQDVLLRPRWWTRRTAVRHYDRAAEILAVLQHARAIVEAGWVQNRWTLSAPPSTAPTAGRRTVVATADPAVAACGVASVALAVRARDPRADIAVATGPALAFLHDVVYDGARARRAAGRAAPHAERIARMRELARWNDEPGRTRADVVAALDTAAARVVAATVDPVRA